MPLGEFCWYDLTTTDPEGARAFYGELLGFGAGEPDPRGYAMWKHAGNAFGGVMQLPDEAREMGAPSHWLGYVWVADAAAAAAKCAELGGTVRVPATDIGGDMGRFAILSDPCNVNFAVYQSSAAGTGEEVPDPVDWIECYSSDPAATWAFFEGMFGWEKTGSMEMPGGVLYEMFGRGEAPFGGLMQSPPEMPASAFMFYFHSDDVDGAAERAGALGATTVAPPMDIPGGGRIAVFMDPQGAGFAIHQD